MYARTAKSRSENTVKNATRKWVPMTRLKKKPVRSRFFLEGSFRALIRKSNANSRKKKPKRSEFPPQAIISEYPSKKTKSHVAMSAANWLPDNFFAKRKKGTAIIENTNAAATFNAVNSSRNPRNTLSTKKNKGL
jgi:hypothetical protein